MIGVPAGVAPARLYRMLLQRPRATAPIVYRIRGAEDIPLRVRALSSLDEAAILDAAEGEDGLGGSRAASELLARALLTSEGSAFASASDVDALEPSEVVSLSRAVRAALDVISPTYARHDHVAWARALKKGATAPGNWAATLALGGCMDHAFGFGSGRCVERPDRYFGVPLADLTDGQWMVYRAAVEAFEESRKK